MGPEGCKHFVAAVKERYAWGFTHLFKDLLTQKKLSRAVSRVSALYAEKEYYAKRKGSKFLTPSEQETIIQILNDIGFSLPEGEHYFDKYREGYAL